MSGWKTHLTILKRKFVPSHRFLPTSESTIDRIQVLKTELNSSCIKVLNWNIAKKNYEPNWRKDFLKILDKYQPDLIFLQEVRVNLETENLVELKEMSWAFAPNYIDTHYQSYSGILTAAKINPLSRKAIITKHCEPITKTPKVSLLIEYPLFHQQKNLLTVNSHFINFVTLKKFKMQLQELELILSTHDGPIIFSGDFNTWNRKRARLLHAAVNRLGLIPVTFTSQESKKIKRFLLSPPLDYIFYRGLWENKAKATVLDHICSSDHKPLLAEFSYLERQKSKDACR